MKELNDWLKSPFDGLKQDDVAGIQDRCFKKVTYFLITRLLNKFAKNMTTSHGCLQLFLYF